MSGTAGASSLFSPDSPLAGLRKSARARWSAHEGVPFLPAPRIACDAWVSPCQGGRRTRLNSARVLAVPQAATWGRSRSAATGLDLFPPRPSTGSSSAYLLFSPLNAILKKLLKKTFADETPTGQPRALSVRRPINGNIPAMSTVAVAISVVAFCRARWISQTGYCGKRQKEGELERGKHLDNVVWIY